MVRLIFPPPLSFPSEYPIVASKPSNISKMLHSIDDALNQIRAMDLENISEKVQSTLRSIEQVMTNTNIGNISEKIEKSVDRAGQILDDKRWGQHHRIC